MLYTTDILLDSVEHFFFFRSSIRKKNSVKQNIKNQENYQYYYPDIEAKL